MTLRKGATLLDSKNGFFFSCMKCVICAQNDFGLSKLFTKLIAFEQSRESEKIFWFFFMRFSNKWYNIVFGLITRWSKKFSGLKTNFLIYNKRVICAWNDFGLPKLFTRLLPLHRAMILIKSLWFSCIFLETMLFQHAVQYSVRTNRTIIKKFVMFEI